MAATSSGFKDNDYDSESDTDTPLYDDPEEE